ncbi:hypothetical protein GCM10007415_25110 [Parapedobacter pyrenivorans]|uniref:Uncharacterized protein n=1 Tax=Parapedobacter pyrenivorans TaxID=1305674 RepID=A0A917MBM7_9SPHI|nr:hypothetical protein [Parapedobacter pyrenivorans]GGG89816.1 hypothetical protein GCM10007415_25110 [Parapedobacter pyrenivorans]
MKHGSTPNAGGKVCVCGRIIGILYPELKQIRADQQEILNYILEKQQAEIEYCSAEQAMDRIGISQSTLLRCQRRGEITVAKFIERKKYFRDRDVERLRREYRGRE